jgi:hypothetical protein
MNTIRIYELTDEQVAKILDHCDSMIEMYDDADDRRVYEEIEMALLVHFGPFEDETIDSECDSEI